MRWNPFRRRKCRTDTVRRKLFSKIAIFLDSAPAISVGEVRQTNESTRDDRRWKSWRMHSYFRLIRCQGSVSWSNVSHLLPLDMCWGFAANYHRRKIQWRKGSRASIYIGIVRSFALIQEMSFIREEKKTEKSISVDLPSQGSAAAAAVGQRGKMTRWWWYQYLSGAPMLFEKTLSNQSIERKRRKITRKHKQTVFTTVDEKKKLFFCCSVQRPNLSRRTFSVCVNIWTFLSELERNNDQFIGIGF